MASAIVIILAAVPVLMTFSPCQAATVGVSVGDWFKYRGTVLLWEAGPAVSFPPHQYAAFLVTYNQSDWIKYTVTEFLEIM
ncbi:MAG: hypothetical protein QW056_02375 [Candidatus Bathyarchaeia archaeon]